MADTEETKRQKMTAYKAAMEESRISFESHWRDIADHTYPRSYRWLDDSWTSKGNKYNQKIIDSSATDACRLAVSYFASNVTSPSRPWKKLRIGEKRFRTSHTVKSYMATVDEMLDELILKSNFYQEAAKLYEQMILFGTSAMLIEADWESAFHCETIPVGEFWLGCDSKRRVNQFMRRLKMTARQMHDAFGYDVLSTNVKRAYDDHRVRDVTRFDVLHYIGPNEGADLTKIEAKYKAIKSWYMEEARGDGDDVLLRESGYDSFPVVAPRWKTYSDDTYGVDSPGMTALSDIKQLQKMQKDITKASQKMLSPPTQGPETTRRQTMSMLPGDHIVVDGMTNNGGIRPVYEVRYDINGAEMQSEKIRERIRSAFFSNLFLMVANERRSGTKAREIEELHEEKMLALATVFEQFSQEFLSPSVERMLDLANAYGRFPAPPPELEGQEYDIEFVSTMAQAMKLVGIGNVDRAIALMGQLGSARPEVLDLVNFDRTFDGYVDRLGIDPRMLNSPREVNAIRSARAQQLAQQQQMQTAQINAETAKVLSDTKTDGDTALNDLIQQARNIQ